MKPAEIAVILGGKGSPGEEGSSGGGAYGAAIGDMRRSGLPIKDRKLFREGLKAFIEQCLADREAGEDTEDTDDADDDEGGGYTDEE